MLVRKYSSDIENILTCAAFIKQIIKEKLPTNALMAVIGEESNPLKGWCYVSTALLYKKFDGKGMQLRKQKDFEDQWHWWVVFGAEERIIDITSDQYEHQGHKPPYIDEPDGYQNVNLMTFTSYKNKVNALDGELEEYELNGKRLMDSIQ